MMEISVFIIYFAPLLAIWALYGLYRRRREKSAIGAKQEATESGLLEPASLHPLIDANRCLGCGACTRACPEGNILGLINGKAQLVTPANCIGHGACQTACPFNAITLVLGSETRGVDIPVVNRHFETNVPGIFIAGELGGMGLIRNAMEQGKQAVTEIIKSPTVPHQDKDSLDLMIIGAGPAGIAASITAKAGKLNFVTIDQDSLGGTVAHFPRNKVVMTAPLTLPIVGKIKFKETTKEALLEFWQQLITQTGLNIHFNERLLDVKQEQQGFSIRTSEGSYQSQRILLCLGRRGSPRKLNVKGEDLPKVVYRLVDAAQYRHQQVLVVGGSDSALEAAIGLAEEPGTQVTLSYRGDVFSRAKAKNRKLIEAAIENKTVKVLLNSQLQSITAKHVEIKYQDQLIKLNNNAVIICAGGILPTAFLQSIGIDIETKYGAL